MEFWQAGILAKLPFQDQTAMGMPVPQGLEGYLVLSASVAQS